jgi:two-component system chemotaxis response regulator CheB
MDDGAAGLRAIRLSGGMSIVQDPAEAAFPGMPTAAIAEAEPEAVCRVGEMVSRLTEWIKDLPDDLPRAEAVGESTRGSKEMSELSEFTCPECGGTLWEDRSYGTERYRCRVGHSFSADNLLIGKQDAIEAALWAAIVALQERADISKRVMKRLEGVARPARLLRLQREIEETSGRVNVLHGLIDELVQQAAFDDEIVTVGNERDDADATG